MKVDSIEKLIDLIGEDMLCCGEFEYNYLHRIRGILHEYVEAMRKTGPGQPRVGYRDKELNND